VCVLSVVDEVLGVGRSGEQRLGCGVGGVAVATALLGPCGRREVTVHTAHAPPPMHAFNTSCDMWFKCKQR